MCPMLLKYKTLASILYTLTLIYLPLPLEISYRSLFLGIIVGFFLLYLVTTITCPAF
jgi:multisubunit Na+/H+ antiporter MnhE subunit